MRYASPRPMLERRIAYYCRRPNFWNYLNFILRMKQYDAIIIGAGQSGMPLARRISKKGLRVALIERDNIGGTCINDGCSPTKTMVASAKVAHMVSRASDFGIQVSAFKVDQKEIKRRSEERRVGKENKLEWLRR